MDANMQAIHQNMMVLFIYTINHLSQTDKIRFFYRLHGRNKNKGLVRNTHSEKLAKGVLLVPLSEAITIQEFLEEWDCTYEQRKIIIAEDEL